MLTEFFDSPLRIRQLREGPYGRFLEGFAQELSQAGYAEITARGHLRSAEHLCHWTGREGVPISALDRGLVEDFGHHLGRCDCAEYGHTQKQKLKKGVNLFFGYLQRCAAVATPPHAVVPVSPLFASFAEWMRRHRGTCDITLTDYGRPIRALLESLGEDPGKFEAQSLRRFVLENSQASGWGAAKRCTTALRMFLRFLIAEGKCSAHLLGSIPVLAHWRLSSLPRYLQPGQVEQIISSCPTTTAMGRRDRAILLLLARLGLRAGDIVELRLGDIDWRQAWIQVCGKGRSRARLPLTQEVGDAMAGYITDGRPPADTQTLFLRSLAPVGPFRSHCAVSVIAARAMRRAGVICPSRGAAHVLRHSAASSMLAHGASLQEIATILRHRSIETTEIYAKIDVGALRQIAQPWPEVEPC
jgi:site-specific recombinase XerD